MIHSLLDIKPPASLVYQKRGNQLQEECVKWGWVMRVFEEFKK
jgi:hypothetical protein